MLIKTLKHSLANTICVLIDLIIGYLLIERLNYSAGLSLTISTAVNTPLLYLISEYFVFNTGLGSSVSSKRVSKFIVGVLITFIIRQALIQSLTRLDFGPIFGEYFLLAISMCLTFGFSLWLFDHWIFRANHDSAHDAQLR